MPPLKGSVLVLSTPADSDAARSAAAAAGLEAKVVPTLSALFAQLANDWTATLVSLSVESVDQEVVRRIAATRGAGALLLSAAGISLDTALAAEHVGAAALLREPLDAPALAERLGRLLDEGGSVPLRAHSTGPGGDADQVLIGQSTAMGPVFETLARVAASDTTVLITGESGTGKEVVARTLHRTGSRRDGPFVAVNCAAIPTHLLESELFGHERGAFTGAVARHTGRFERADGGTLFLDEIADMSLVLQAKVLRVLEERTLERVGGREERPIDVRIIAATNKDLGEATRDGRFREDLYFRLAVVELDLPPLRERDRDLRDLALHFGARFAERHGRPVEAITESALHRLESAPWPGNVRELRNVMDRAVLLARGSTIRTSDLRLGPAAPRLSARSVPHATGGYAPTLSLQEVEADHIRRVLASVNGRLGRAAEILDIHRNTLSAKVRDYGLLSDSDA